eukprot:431567-Pyramimonas_sp.AAC.2
MLPTVPNPFSAAAFASPPYRCPMTSVVEVDRPRATVAPAEKIDSVICAAEGECCKIISVEGQSGVGS